MPETEEKKIKGIRETEEPEVRGSLQNALNI